MSRTVVLAAVVGLTLSAQPASACPECERLAKQGAIASGKGQRWSQAETWKNGRLPKKGEAVVIPSGKKVTLDVSPPKLKSLFVSGQLVFAEKDLSLDAGWILVTGEGAEFQIGREKSPFKHQAVITLHGTDEKANVVGDGLLSMGTKFLGTKDGGRLELHGARRESVSWTQLAEHARPGDTTITLVKNVDWQPGDVIAVAPSGFSCFDAESVTVNKVDGNVVHFKPALKHMHWGELQTYGDKVLDERAEVGLLTRNIVIRGAKDSLDSAFGGHVMIMYDSIAHVDGVEFFRMGQRGHQGRYPMHWHLVDRYGSGGAPGKGQYAKDCSIHHSFQRAIVVHGTSGVRVEDNVAYDVTNHCYVPAEDGDEEGNVFIRNLGMLVRKPGKTDIAFPNPKGGHVKSLQREAFASVFWMKNPNQVFIDNHAAGSESGNGFFFDNTKTPASRDYDRLDGMVFRGNVAHSNGPNIDDGEFEEIFPGGLSYQFANTRFGLFTLDVGGRGKDRKKGRFVVEDFTAYKNETGGAWTEKREETLRDCIFADQPEGVRVIQNAILEDIVFVGASTNTLGNERRSPGHYGRDNAGFGRENPTAGLFFNKRNTGTAFRGTNLAFFNCAHGIHVHQSAPQGQLNNSTFHNVDAPFYANIGAYGGKGKYGGDMRVLDADGSVTGTGAATFITGESIGKKSRQQTEWGVYLTPR